MYLLAIILPPVAVFICGKPIQSLLNLFLWCLFIVPGVLHAILVVNEYKSTKNAKKYGTSKWKWQQKGNAN